jgi:hypothetical protein
MVSAVHLDYQFFFQTDKVEDIITEWMLTAELEIRNLSAAQNIPQSLFRV